LHNETIIIFGVWFYGNKHNLKSFGGIDAPFCPYDQNQESAVELSRRVKILDMNISNYLTL